MALPVYAMSCFLLPDSILKKLNSTMMEFWWNTKVDKKPIYWVAWESLCKPKSKGGLGFKDLAKFNQSLLAKQAWRILDKPDSLLAQVYKDRYFPRSSITKCGLGSRPSYAWRSIIHGRNLLVKGLVRVIGDGNDSFVWTDRWVPYPTPRAPLNINSIINVHLRVSSLICPLSGYWRLDELNRLFPHDDCLKILSLIPNMNRTDRDVWSCTKTGAYTVSSGYEFACTSSNDAKLAPSYDQPSIEGLLKEVWEVKTLPKIKIFIWKSLKGAIAVASRLRSRSLHVDPLCRICRAHEETVNHVLFDCIEVRRTWLDAGFDPYHTDFLSHSLYSNFDFLLSLRKDRSVSDSLKHPWPWIVWGIWKGRNNLVFKGEAFCRSNILAQARADATAWFQAQDKVRAELQACNSGTPQRFLSFLPITDGFLLCTISCCWRSSLPFLGTSWILRNEMGVTLFHGRAAPDAKANRFLSSLSCLAWVVDCLRMVRHCKVLFALEDADLLDAIHNPANWPLYQYLVEELVIHLSEFEEFRCIKISASDNKCAAQIANSVVRDGRVQSYIQSSAPCWLERDLQDEAILFQDCFR